MYKQITAALAFAFATAANATCDWCQPQQPTTVAGPTINTTNNTPTANASVGNVTGGTSTSTAGATANGGNGGTGGNNSTRNYVIAAPTPGTAAQAVMPQQDVCGYKVTGTPWGVSAFVVAFNKGQTTEKNSLQEVESCLLRQFMTSSNRFQQCLGISGFKYMSEVEGYDSVIVKAANEIKYCNPESLQAPTTVIVPQEKTTNYIINEKPLPKALNMGE